MGLEDGILTRTMACDEGIRIPEELLSRDFNSDPTTHESIPVYHILLLAIALDPSLEWGSSELRSPKYACCNN